VGAPSGFTDPANDADVLLLTDGGPVVTGVGGAETVAGACVEALEPPASAIEVVVV
jgi:hypothetical protein